jgi:hypothetical protein
MLIYIIENCSEWDSETVFTDHLFLTLMMDFDFNFCLGMFSSTFPQSDSLFQTLQSTTCDSVYCNKKIEDFKAYFR